MSPEPTAPGSKDLDAEQQSLRDALAGLMASVARLGVAQGLPYATVEEMLRLAFVQSAARAHPGLPEHRKVSRISTTTGINRREVTRLVATQQAPQSVVRGRSLASEVFAHWRTQPPYLGEDGEARTLPRLGAAPSFESLAQAITRDVHPRSLLDELVRLGQARWDEATDTVSLVSRAFVARGDRARQLGFLGDNVGDHLRAAIDNVLAGGASLHFEQALFADGLSAASIASVRPTVHEQWQTLLRTLVPALEARVDTDAQLQPAPQGRLRVGLYTYCEGAEPAAAGAAAAAPPTSSEPGSAAQPRPPARKKRKT
jgi:hypothetical protein